MKTIRIALIGYGNVGQAFARMLKRREDYLKDTFDAKAIITGICTRSRGAVIRENGIDTETLTDDMFDKDKDAFAVIESGEYDVMVELTPINIMTGQPATDHVRRALDLGKHVITANKGPVAWHYRAGSGQACYHCQQRTGCMALPGAPRPGEREGRFVFA